MTVHRTGVLPSRTSPAVRWRIVLAACIVIITGQSAAARPTTPVQALSAVHGWLGIDARPLGAHLGVAAGDVQAYRDSRGEPLYFVVNLDPEGYVIVSADDLVEPIIAWSPTGRYDPSPQNPLFVLAQRDLAGRIHAARAPGQGDAAAARGRPLRPEQTAARGKWSKLFAGVSLQDTTYSGVPSVSDARVDPMVASRWSQTTECVVACYNYYTPPRAAGSSSNYPAGCVATAMAQLMRFWQYPTAGVGTDQFTIKVCNTWQQRALRGGDGLGGPYNWADMALDPNCSTTDTQRQAIGALCADAGVAVNMEYCFGASGISDLSRVVSALTSTFMYSNAKIEWDNDTQLPAAARDRAINSNLNAGHPVLLGIVGDQTGHVVVCDGYGYNAATPYHHLNMGWAGASDAWYNLPIVNSTPGYSTVAAVIYNVYTSGTGEIIAGRVTDAVGNPVEGALVSAGSFSDTTNSRGLYALVGLASGTQYTVSVAKAGYQFAPQIVSTGTSINNTPDCGNLSDVDFVAEPGEITVDAANVPVPEGGTASFGVKLAAQPPGDVTVTVSVASGDSDVSVDSGASLLFTPSNWDVYQPVTLAAAQDADAIAGSATVRCSAPGYNDRDLTASEVDDDIVIVTDVSAVSVGEGSTAQFNVKLLAEPAGDVTVTVTRVSGDADVTVQSGSVLLFTASDWDVYQPVTLYAALDPDTSNGVAVIRCSADGWTSKDVTATETDLGSPPDTQPPTVPTGLSATTQSQTRVALSWNPSTDNVAVAGYKVYRDGSYLGSSADTSFYDNTCTANTTYYYSVSAYDGRGNESAQCATVGVTTFPYIDIVMDEEKAVYFGSWASGTAVPPDAYEGDYKYTMSAANETAWAKWTPNFTRSGNWAVYIYYREGPYRSVKAPFTVTYYGGSDTFEIDQTTNGGRWVYLTTRPFLAGTAGCVKVANGTAETSMVICADAVKFTFVSALPGSDTDPPTVPTGLYEAGASASQVDLMWTESTDNSAVAGYKIFRDGEMIGASPTNSYSDTECLPNTTYTYSVSAYDTHGNESARCEAIQVTTASAFDLIVDEDQAVGTGAWSSGNYLLEQAYDQDYKWASTSETSETYYARYQPDLPSDGTYQIYVRHVAGPPPNNRSVQAKFTVSYYGGSQNYQVDQSQVGGQWVYLATKPFLAGTAGYVKLSNFTGEAGKVVIADAVKFTYAGPLPSPPAAPTDLSPTAISPGNITWRWTDVKGEFGYRVRDNNGVNRSGDLGPGVTEWTEGGLTANTQYFRRIHAFNANGESGGSMGQILYSLARAGEDSTGTGSTGNVWCTTAAKDTWYGPGKSFVFTNPLGFGTGGHWKASSFEYKWNKTSDETWAAPGANWSSGTISLSANAGDGYYYLHVRALNGDGVPNNGQVCDYGPFKCDLTPPAAVTVTDEGNWTPSVDTIKASWTASSDASGSDIARYEYAIGTTTASQDVRAWTSAGLNTSVTATGLALRPGQEYFVQVRVIDNVGLASAVGATDGITAAIPVASIGQVWAKADLVDPLALLAKTVTAVKPGAFWIEEQDRSSAIKVVSAAAVAVGDKVSVAGVLGMDGTQRALLGDVVIPAGSGSVPQPLMMSVRNVGGSSLNEATPGVTNGVGLYNIALLVRCFGRVVSSDVSDPDNVFCYIGDGSSFEPLLVRCGGVTPPSTGAVVVTGVVASERSGSDVVPVLIIRGASDIVPL